MKVGNKRCPNCQHQQSGARLLLVYWWNRRASWSCSSCGRRLRISGWSQFKVLLIILSLFIALAVLVTLRPPTPSPYWYLAPFVVAYVFEILLVEVELADRPEPVFEPPPDDLSEATECLACGGTIPAGYAECPKCGWTYKVTQTGISSEPCQVG